MPLAIFISGSINSGKTTVAKILLKKIPKAAHVEIDNLREFIEWMPLEESIPINLENAAAVIKNFLNKNFNVIVSYPLNKKEFDFFCRNIDKKHQIYFFVLNPRIDIILRNRNNRILSDWEMERIKHHYKIGVNNPGFGINLDNSNQIPEETAEEIIKNLTM